MTKDISPPLLGAKFESKLVTISSSLLQQWCAARPGSEDSTTTPAAGEAEESTTDSPATTDLTPTLSSSGDDEGSKVESKPEGPSVGSLSSKQLLKLQKEAVCREFVANMKPYYKTKFKAKVLHGSMIQ